MMPKKQKRSSDFPNPGHEPMKMDRGDMKEGMEESIKVMAHTRGKPAATQKHPAKPAQPTSMKFLD